MIQCPHCKGSGEIADPIASPRLRHGLSGRSSPEYNSWCAMRQRCDNPNHNSYENYGGRGITICKRWTKFDNFYSDMGPRPENTSLDRIDPEGDYTPENCRWTSRKDQQRNRRDNNLIEVDGVIRCVTEWAELIGLSPRAITYRLSLGWTAEQAIMTPRLRRLKGGPRHAIQQKLRAQSGAGVQDRQGAW